MTFVRWLRPLAGLLGAALFGLAVLSWRLANEGERELGLSDTAFDQGDLPGSLLHARRAAILFAPGLPHVRPAYERMIAVAIGAEAKGDRATAERAWRAVREAALETRHLTQPHAADLERANQAIARLQAARQAAKSQTDPETFRAEAHDALARDTATRTPWVAVLLVGCVLAGAGLGLTALRGFTRDGRFQLNRAWAGLLLVLIGAACWTLAVYQA